jgi:hypothetical protein
MTTATPTMQGENQFYLFAATGPTDAAQRIANWLETCPKIESARPVFVTIGKVTYIGALYVELDEAQATERVVTDGPIKAGEEMRSYRLYLLGPLPKLRRKNNVYVYQFDLNDREALERCYDETDEWYVACHSANQKTDEVNAKHSPFGRTFMLCLNRPMNFGYYKGWKIDTGDRYEPYPRIKMAVEFLAR